MHHAMVAVPHALGGAQAGLVLDGLWLRGGRRLVQVLVNVVQIIIIARRRLDAGS